MLRTLHLGDCHVEIFVRQGGEVASPAPRPDLTRASEATNGPALRAPPDQAAADDGEPDLARIQRRAQGMADGLRLVLERSRDGTRSLSEVSLDEPRLGEALERAGAGRGRRIWFLGRSGRRMWPDELQCVAGCYEVLAEAAGLLACVEELRGLEQARRKQAYELAAEAQSALRKALRELAGLRRSDQDRQEVFDWLHEHRAHQHIFIERYMRRNDLADPWTWEARGKRLAAMRSSLRAPLRLQRQADELVALLAYHAGKLEQRRDSIGAWRDWQVIDQSAAWLVRLGAATWTGELTEVVDGLPPPPEALASGPGLAELLAVLRAPQREERPRARRRTRARLRAGPASVLEIFREAEARHPDRLAFRPNHHSERDYPYDRPAEVAAAVEWLLGPYWETRARLRRCDHRELDLLLRRACGWTYKPGQSSATVGRYRSWYETTHEGRRVAVLEHIGRGNAKRQGPESIRIGFTWDEVSGKVIVGFVGQHQRNRDS